MPDRDHRKGTAARRNGQVVSSGETCDAVDEDRNVFFTLHKTFRALNDHLGHAFVVLRALIEGGIDDFHIRSLNRFFNVGDLLRTFVDQKDDRIHLRVVPQDGFCRILQRRFSGF